MLPRFYFPLHYFVHEEMEKYLLSGSLHLEKRKWAKVHLEIFLQPWRRLSSQVVLLLPMWKGKAAASSIEQTQTNPAPSQRGSFAPGVLHPRHELETYWKGQIVHPIGFEILSRIWVLCHCIIIILPLVQ